MKPTFVISTVALLYVLVCAQEAGAQNHGDLRLVQQDAKNAAFTAGRLEIYINSTWGSICADNFDMHDADVACKQLGFSRAVQVATSFHTPYGRGKEGPVWLDEVECREDSLLHILSCSHVRHDEIDCDHFSDVAIECSRDLPQVPAKDLDVRLVGGKFKSQGTLEVHCNSSWASVCPARGTTLRKMEGDAICRQLGYTESVKYIVRDKLNETKLSLVSYQDYECPGDAQNLASCGATCEAAPAEGSTSSGISAMLSGCIYLECAHLVPYGSIRLSNETAVTLGALGGRLEIFRDGEWGTMCINGFNYEAANVSCQQLGFSRALYFGVSEEEGYGQGREHSPIFSGPGCSTNDKQLVKCSFDLTKDENCTHFEDVAIFCSNDITTPESSPGLANNSGKKIPLEIFIALILASCLLFVTFCTCMVVYSCHFKLVPYDTMKKPASHGLYFTEFEGSNLTLNELNLERMLESPASRKLQRCRKEDGTVESTFCQDLNSKNAVNKDHRPVSPTSPSENRYTTVLTQRPLSPPYRSATSLPLPRIPTSAHQAHSSRMTSPILLRKFNLQSVSTEAHSPVSPMGGISSPRGGINGPIPPPLVVKRNLVVCKHSEEGEQLHTAVDMTAIASVQSKKEETPCNSAKSPDLPAQSSTDKVDSQPGGDDDTSSILQAVLLRPAPQKGIRKLGQTLSQISEINLEAVAINESTELSRNDGDGLSATYPNPKSSHTHRVSFKF